MMRRRGDRFRRFRIPNDTITIRTDSDATFFRVKIEYSSSIRTGHSDELTRIKFACFYTLGPNHS